MFKLLLFFVWAAFGTFTAAAMWQEGPSGLFASVTHSMWSVQIFIDLVIALSLVMVWMWRDAKNTHRKIWPWIFLTLVAGSLGPLLYLITGKKREPD